MAVSAWRALALAAFAIAGTANGARAQGAELDEARVMLDLAREALDAVDLPAAREMASEAVQLLLAQQGAETDAGWVRLLDAAGRIAFDAQDVPTARAAWQRVHDVRARALPEDHSDLLLARWNLGNALNAGGELVEARALFELVLETCERTLPEDHAYLVAARGNLARTMRALGDLAGARRLQELALAGFERTLPEDHFDVLVARVNLAGTLAGLGDLAAARALFQGGLEGFERTLPADHPVLLMARGNLAAIMKECGDLAGARALEESVLAAQERLLPPDHPDLDMTRANLASTLRRMGDLPAARALQESVLASGERTLPEDHPALLTARGNLANTLRELGELETARELEERVLAALERTLPEDHPWRLRACSNLALTTHGAGDLQRARALQERALAGLERVLSGDVRTLSVARAQLSVTLYEMGDLDSLRALQPALVAGLARSAVDALTSPPRAAREAIGADEQELALALLFGAGAEASDRRALFELVETRRMVATAGLQAAQVVGNDAGLAVLAREAADARAELHDLVAGAGSAPAPAPTFRDELDRLVAARDRAEGAIRGALAERGLAAEPISARALAAALTEGSAAVGFLRHGAPQTDPSSGRLVPGADRLLAHVLRPDGGLARVDLGGAAELERATASWRAALGSPLEGRGLTVGPASEPESEIARGEELRRLLLDPVLAAAGAEVRSLLVCPDDLVFLVALDALPLGGGRVGDQVRIVVEPSFAPLVRPAARRPGDPTLVALGGIDYGDAPPNGSREALCSLPGSRTEVESIARLFERAFGRPPSLLAGASATKAALESSAAGTRYLHVATHGWFAPESVRSALDEPAGDRGWRPLGIEERVSGLAPMTLCGLALAGANLGRDSLGRVPGILTAEELSALDLKSSELAVLSACETNVGIRRAGQGIQSLQAALHGAGARTAITSLWKVDDAATQRLFEVFYTKLWEEGLGKAEALWQAKLALRAEGSPTRDWAAWVLTGAPE